MTMTLKEVMFDSLIQVCTMMVGVVRSIYFQSGKPTTKQDFQDKIPYNVLIIMFLKEKTSFGNGFMILMELKR